MTRGMEPGQGPALPGVRPGGPGGADTHPPHNPQELKLKDEECERLSKVREQLEQELEELTASLFEVQWPATWGPAGDRVCWGCLGCSPRLLLRKPTRWFEKRT